MIRRQPRSTRTYTRCPYPTLFRSPEQGSAAAVIFEIVDVAADVRTGGAHRIDIAALPAVGARGAEGERVAERHVDHCRAAPRRVAAVSEFGAAEQLHLEARRGRLVGDEFQKAAQRAGPIERALRAAQHFDPPPVVRTALASAPLARAPRMDRVW